MILDAANYSKTRIPQFMGERFQNIKNFIKAALDDNEKIGYLYTQNFREMIKLIPYVGSIIDANTVGAIENQALENRLNRLEEYCADIIKMMSTTKLNNDSCLIGKINEINNNLPPFYVINNNSDVNYTISAIMGSHINYQRVGINPHQNFTFVTISGASASGKDCILDVIQEKKFGRNCNIETLTKITTRRKRTVDSKYYEFTSFKKFQVLKEKEYLLFPYLKRGDYYGFDRAHFLNAVQKEVILICIYTNFQTLFSDWDFLKKQGIRHISICLQADLNTLVRRSHGRILEPTDIEKRKESIQQDINFLTENPRLLDCFDLVIQNGDAVAKLDVYSEIEKLVI